MEGLLSTGPTPSSFLTHPLLIEEGESAGENHMDFSVQCSAVQVVVGRW